MSEKKPTPLFTEPTVKLCPVCGKKAYSRAGVHPQCAMLHASRNNKIRAAARVLEVPSSGCDASPASCEVPEISLAAVPLGPPTA